MRGGSVHIFENKFKEFKEGDIEKQLGVEILTGLALAPHVEYKMQPQSMNRTHGNDYITRHIRRG